MKRYFITSSKIPKLKPNVSCIGNFDASHRGHQALYKKTVSLARKNNLTAYLITFKEDPNTVLYNEKPIYSLKTRLKIYESFGFDGIIIINSNKSFYKKSAKDFIDKYLLKLNIKYLISGSDFKFGKNQKGDIKLLKKYFNLSIVKPIKYKGKKISTHRIKKSIIEGNYNDANKMLGYAIKNK